MLMSMRLVLLIYLKLFLDLSAFRVIGGQGLRMLLRIKLGF